MIDFNEIMQKRNAQRERAATEAQYADVMANAARSAQVAAARAAFERVGVYAYLQAQADQMRVHRHGTRFTRDTRPDRADARLDFVAKQGEPLDSGNEQFARSNADSLEIERVAETVEFLLRDKRGTILQNFTIPLARLDAEVVSSNFERFVLLALAQERADSK
ncbi:hypothetical protein [Cupriavidus basilensis]|uniref:hypothetical protein n=1 Tax=Cupriavidus basilensis TaxID=68895 RepID=UPI0039F689FB